MFSIYMGMTCSHVIYSSDWSAEPHIVWSTQVVCRNTQVCTQHRLSHVCLYIDIRTHTQIALNLIGQHIRMMVKCWTVCSAKLVLARLHPAQCHYTYVHILWECCVHFLCRVTYVILTLLHRPTITMWRSVKQPPSQKRTSTLTGCRWSYCQRN